ncbi:hypothetical protein SK571_26815, partial [Lentzea sp. BCCO 10_0798]
TGTLILLLLAVLDYRSEVAEADRMAVPVPVLLPVAEWDPRAQSLLAWAEVAILRDHTYLKASSYGHHAVRSLLDAGRISLFLDGFDEIPQPLRTLALRRIDEETGQRIVLASRITEYGLAVARGALAHTAVIDLRPVGTKAAADYLLNGLTGRRRDVWRRFIDRLSAEPTSAVAVALGTPLALSLVKKVYAEHNDPAVLFDPVEFATPDRVIRHLISAALPAAYPDPAAREAAQRFLVWIAKKMSQRQLQDLAWWRIRYWTLPWLPPVAASFLFGLLGLLIGVFTQSTPFGVVFGTAWFVCAATTSAVIVVRGAKRLVSLRGMLPRLAVAVGLGLMFGGGVVLVRLLASGLDGGVGVSAGFGVLFGVLFGVTSGALVGLVALHDGPLVSRVRRPSRGDLAAGVMTGGMTGIATMPLSNALVQTAIAIVGGVGFTITVAWTRPAPHPQDEVNALTSYQGDRRGGAVFSIVAGLFSGLGIGVGAAVALGAERGILIGAASAVAAGVAGAVSASQVVAFRLVTAPLVFAGRLPRRPMAVLADAYERQILRQVGTTYQFRHSELQDYLSSLPG